MYKLTSSQLSLPYMA